MEETFHIDTVCHSGRPSDSRSAKETACYDLLDSLGIAYERVDHDAAMTMELCHAAEGVLQAPRFGCHPCINTSSLAFSTQDLTEKLLPALGHAPVLVDLPEDGDA